MLESENTKNDTIDFKIGALRYDTSHEITYYPFKYNFK